MFLLSGECGWSRLKPDFGYTISVLERRLKKKTKKLKGVFQADGASPLEALLLQHHQVNEYRQPQIILSLRKRICSMKMTHLITSPCHESWHTCSRLHLPSNASWNHRDILSKIPSVISKLSAWHLLLCILYIYMSKWFDVIMTVLASAHPSGRTAHVIYLLIICASNLI